MHFEVVKWRFQAPRRSHPCVVLEQGPVWDDFGFKTRFFAYYARKPGDWLTRLGAVKILSRESPTTAKVLEPRFRRLGPSFCSLGQDREYYVALSRLPSKTRHQVLVALRDAAIFPPIRRRFEDEHGFTVSLARSPEAQRAFRHADEYLEGRSTGTELKFTFRGLLKGFTEPHELAFRFEPQAGGLGRAIAVIGANGCGKTQLLGAMARRLSFREGPGRITPARPDVSSVIAVSYSAFDQFQNPRTSSGVGYWYCGLRDQVGKLNLPLAMSQLHRDFYEMERRGQWGEWCRLLESSQIPAETPTTRAQRTQRLAQSRWAEALSPGHTLVVVILAALMARVTENSIVLFDEPEVHLHPSLLARLLSCLHEILDLRSAYAVLATHSPLVLQSIPSRFVWIVHRVGKVPKVRRYPGESFGEGLSALVQRAFGVGEDQRNDLRIMREALATHSPKQVRKMLGGKLSLGAQVSLDALAQERSKR